MISVLLDWSTVKNVSRETVYRNLIKLAAKGNFLNIVKDAGLFFIIIIRSVITLIVCDEKDRLVVVYKSGP